jgi:hypothetical protein
MLSKLFSRIIKEAPMGNRQIEVQEEDRKIIVALERFPDICPICSHNIDPRVKFGYTDERHMEVQLVCQCPRSACHGVFIAYYVFSSNSVYYLRGLQPQTYRPREFGEYISAVSKDFVTIFNEAQKAEALGLSTIAGPGFRKSLEFLIKDYAVSRSPEARDEIKGKPLSNVINDYATDGNIKSTAKRATWLGNDETHYYRKWEEKDIKDLKLLIELTVRWIESEELTRKYEEDMTD